MKACPYRQDFYQKLGSDQAKVQQQLEDWLSKLEANLSLINKAYDIK